MSLTIKRTLIVILLTLACLAVLLGSLAALNATHFAASGVQGALHNNKQVAWYRPAPPVEC